MKLETLVSKIVKMAESVDVQKIDLNFLTQQELAQVCNPVGDILYDEGRLSDAIVFYRTALNWPKVFSSGEELFTSPDENEKTLGANYLRIYWAQTHNRMGYQPFSAELGLSLYDHFIKEGLDWDAVSLLTASEKTDKTVSKAKELAQDYLDDGEFVRGLSLLRFAGENISGSGMKKSAKAAIRKDRLYMVFSAYSECGMSVPTGILCSMFESPFALHNSTRKTMLDYAKEMDPISPDPSDDELELIESIKIFADSLYEDKKYRESFYVYAALGDHISADYYLKKGKELLVETAEDGCQLFVVHDFFDKADPDKVKVAVDEYVEGLLSGITEEMDYGFAENILDIYQILHVGIPKKVGEVFDEYLCKTSLGLAILAKYHLMAGDIEKASEIAYEALDIDEKTLYIGNRNAGSRLAKVFEALDDRQGKLVCNLYIYNNKLLKP